MKGKPSPLQKKNVVISLTGATVENVVLGPPVISKTEMTKGLSVFFSDNMRRLDHIVNICWLSQIRRCANLRSWIKLPM